jgi:UDPglucose 6-dehydrogenase
VRVGIIGAGYVGIVTGIWLASTGDHEVVFIERRDDRRDAIAAGRPPIVERGLAEAMTHARGRYAAAGRLADAGPLDIALVAVGTPIGEGGRSDLGQLESALDDLRAFPDLDVTIRSTLPPGTSARLPAMLGRPDGRRLSTNPEFLRQGAAMEDVAHPSRVVIGRFAETSDDHLGRVRSLYASVDAPHLAVSVAAAELIKNVANAFLALKLSFVNEVASMAEEFDVDVDEIISGIALDPRIGRVYMRPGLGFGGSCLPKELEVLATYGRRRGLAMHVARATATVNAEQQDRFARRILTELGPGERCVAVLGLSFKAGTDDLRGSPAIALVRHLLDEGVQVIAFDPAVTERAALAEVAGLSIAPDAASAVAGADAVVIATEWPEFRELDWAALASSVRRPLLYDGRNLLDRDAMVRAGFAYRGVGRRSKEPAVARATAAAAVGGAGGSD